MEGITLAAFIGILQRRENETTEFIVDAHKEMARDVCAFLNTDGGMVVVGVSDGGEVIGVNLESGQRISDFLSSISPAPQTRTQKIDISPIKQSKKDGKNFVFIVGVEKSDKLYSVGNIVYIRVGKNNRPLSVNELLEKAAETTLLRFDEQTMNLPSSILSRKMVESHRNQILTRRGLKEGGSYEDVLEKLKVTINGKPTKAGILMFSENPQKYIPYSKVRLIWFTDENRTTYLDNKEFVGPMWLIIDEIQKYLASHLKTVGGEIKNFKRQEVLEFPIIALREAIANAVIHRNYYDDAEIVILITPSKIIIRNPGSFPPGVNVSNPIHKPRNPLIAQYFWDIGYVDKWGSGIKKIQSSCEEHPLVSVMFSIEPYSTEVMLEKRVEKVMTHVDIADKKIISLLKSRGPTNSPTIASEIGCSVPTAVKRVNSLRVLGIVESVGRGPTTRYRVKA